MQLTRKYPWASAPCPGGSPQVLPSRASSSLPPRLHVYRADLRYARARSGYRISSTVFSRDDTPRPATINISTAFRKQKRHVLPKAAADAGDQNCLPGKINCHPHAVRSASRSPDPMEMVSLAAVPLASFKPPFERRLAVHTRAVHKPSIRRLFAFGIPFRVFIPQPGSGSMSGMSLLPDARETGSHLYLPMHPEWPCAECSPLRCSPR